MKDETKKQSRIHTLKLKYNRDSHFLQKNGLKSIQVLLRGAVTVISLDTFVQDFSTYSSFDCHMCFFLFGFFEWQHKYRIQIISTEGNLKRKSFGYMQSIECIVYKIASKNEVFFNCLQQVKSIILHDSQFFLHRILQSSELRCTSMNKWNTSPEVYALFTSHYSAIRPFLGTMRWQNKLNACRFDASCERQRKFCLVYAMMLETNRTQNIWFYLHFFITRIFKRMSSQVMWKNRSRIIRVRVMERQRYYEFRVDLSMDKLSPARFHLERIICHINVPQRGSTTNQRENRKKLKIWSGDSNLF